VRESLGIGQPGGRKAGRGGGVAMEEDTELEEGEAKEPCDPDKDFSYLVCCATYFVFYLPCFALLLSLFFFIFFCFLINLFVFLLLSFFGRIEVLPSPSSLPP
jgi:hypothetical protein